MVEISNRQDLEKWLQDKPRDWAQVIALRAGARALPVIVFLLNEQKIKRDLKNQLTLSIGRTFLISRGGPTAAPLEIKNARPMLKVN